MWRSWLARQIVALEAEGSNPFIHPILVSSVKCPCSLAAYIGMSPSGKATDFDSVMRRFESCHPSQRSFSEDTAPHRPVPQEHLLPLPPGRGFFVISHDPLAQSAEHLPFKQGVRSSNLRRVTIKSKRYRCHWRKASGINRFRAFFARKFTNESIDANRCFPLTGGIRTPFSQWLAKQKACSALFEASIFKKGAIFLPIEYTKFAASICWS